MIEIDGGERSGSGTIVRLSVTLCTILGRDLRLANIRAKRDKRGLRPQHRQVVTACADMCGGEVERAEVGSSEIVYRPGSHIKGGAYEWDIGTAGSTTMLAVSLLLVGSFADKPSVFTLKGGLFQDFAPSAHYMRGVLLPLLKRMGVGAELLVKQPGYVPEGRGVLEIRVQPAKSGLRPLTLTDQGKVTSVKGIALSSHLAEQEVSDRMAEECAARLEDAGYDSEIDAIYEATASQKGADLSAWVETDSGAIIGADRAGKLGRRSEEIGRYVAESILDDLKTGATVDRYAADQLIPFCAFASGASEYIIPSVTEHVETNLWLVERILGAKTRLDDGHLRVEGVGLRSRS